MAGICNVVPRRYRNDVRPVGNFAFVIVIRPEGMHFHPVVDNNDMGVSDSRRHCVFKAFGAPFSGSLGARNIDFSVDGHAESHVPGGKYPGFQLRFGIDYRSPRDDVVY